VQRRLRVHEEPRRASARRRTAGGRRSTPPAPPPLELAHCGRVDQRAHERAGLERVADAHLPVGAGEALLELREARLVHQHAPRVVQRWPAVPTREHDRGHRELEVGELVEMMALFAAEL